MGVDAPTANGQLSSQLRPSTPDAHLAPLKRHSLFSDDVRRDSGLASSFVADPANKANMGIDDVPANGHAVLSSKPPSSPSVLLNGETVPTSDQKPLPQRPVTVQGHSTSDTTQIESSKPQSAGTDNDADARNFLGITTEIPSGDLEDPFAADQLSFSKRGSVLWQGAKKTHGKKGSLSLNVPGVTARSQADAHNTFSRPSSANISDEEKRLSQHVRLMYERGEEGPGNTAPSEQFSPVAELPEIEHEAALDQVKELPQIQPNRGFLSADYRPSSRASTTAGRKSNAIAREPWEIAGGIEDWRDVDSKDVDRWGFITPKTQLPLRPSTSTPKGSLSDPNQHAKLRKAPPSRSGPSSVHGAAPPARPTSRPSSRLAPRAPSRASRSASVRSHRSLSSVSHAFRPLSSSSFSPRPRWANAAPLMLTDEPGIPHSSQTPRPDNGSDVLMTARERRRESKWADMAQKVSPNPKSGQPIGEGMSFHFDATTPKIVSRTWKGIPNRWRAAAWHSFLEDSSKRRLGDQHVPETVLIAAFHGYQEEDCADDVQIDTDVPRTIGSHIMFRTRYRGGQRLLFRVLHGLALHFPDVGYVQGMASTVATLLCFYDEERAFVVAVRIWQVRGLAKLFALGFGGLTNALETLEQDWLAGTQVARHLAELGIGPTAYGTKWYLTLFGYSVPFPAQLRVWDVFILLGGGEGGSDGEALLRRGKTASSRDAAPAIGAAVDDFAVLHATSAAMIDGLASSLRNADFEDAMKALTGYIPVGREDVLMETVRREWREHGRRVKGRAAGGGGK